MDKDLDEIYHLELSKRSCWVRHARVIAPKSLLKNNHILLAIDQFSMIWFSEKTYQKSGKSNNFYHKKLFQFFF